ncbi:MAG: hypothetical protein RLZZ500_860 [Bacteroidota bacterium]|jgi:long-subunit fatty acid transport protein
MQKKVSNFLTKPLQILLLLCLSFSVNAQDVKKSDFWDQVQFGGSFGLAIGNGFTNVVVAPSAIYNFNDYVATGVGLQYSVLNQENLYASKMYGGSLIGLVQPIEQVQLSVELEQLRVHYKSELSNYSEHFWNTGLFLGAGYRFENITLGFRYNVLFEKDKGVYGDALMPFVRVFF